MAPTASMIHTQFIYIEHGVKRLTFNGVFGLSPFSLLLFFLLIYSLIYNI
nr:MAG TPA: hypothetical protein [Caudoviricetes sp.]